MERVRYIRLTARCNQNCLYCNVRGVEQGDPRAVETLLQELPPDLDRVILTGGEPLMDARLPELLDAAAARGVPVAIQTNGTLLGTPRLRRALRAHPPQELIVSLDAHEAGLYRTLSRADYFDHAVAGLRVALEDGHAVRVVHLLNGLNHEHVRDFLRLLETALPMVPPVTFTTVIPRGQALDHPALFVPYTNILTHLGPALDHLADRGATYTLAGDYGFPPCVLPPAHRPRSETLAHLNGNPHEEQVAGMFTQPETCRGCVWRHACSGLWVDYVGRFGADELHSVPVTLQPHPRVVAAVGPEVITPYREAMELREGGDATRGQFFVWALTDRCNTTCTFCHQREFFAADPRPELDLDACLALADALGRWRFEEVLLCGGEPLLHPELDRIIGALKEAGVRVALNTNGILLGADRIAALEDAGLDTLVLSLDADNAAVHDELRHRPGLFDQLVDRIGAATLRHLELHLHTVVSQATQEHLGGLPELAVRLGARHLDLTVLMDVVRPDPSLRLPAEALARLLREQLPALAEDAHARGLPVHAVPLPMALHAAFARGAPAALQTLRREPLEPALLAAWADGRFNEEIAESHLCLSAWYDKFMDSRGNLFPCSQSSTFHRDYIVGNLQDTPFDEIMNADRLRAFRRGVPDHPACRRCFSAVVAHPSRIKFLPRYADVIEDPAWFSANLNGWARGERR